MKKIAMFWGTVLIGIVVSMLTVQAVFADEITDLLKQALEQYEKGDYSAAAGNLDYAAQLIRQKKGSRLQALLPEPLRNWSADEPESQSVSTAIFGGGIYAERRYTQDSRSVTVKIVAESPLLQSVMMMLTNPAFAATSGAKLKSIKGHKAVIQYNKHLKEGSINIVVAGRFLVTVEGNEIEERNLMDYAAAIDYQALSASE